MQFPCRQTFLLELANGRSRPHVNKELHAGAVHGGSMTGMFHVRPCHAFHDMTLQLPHAFHIIATAMLWKMETWEVTLAWDVARDMRDVAIVVCELVDVAIVIGADGALVPLRACVGA